MAEVVKWSHPQSFMHLPKGPTFTHFQMPTGHFPSLRANIHNPTCQNKRELTALMLKKLCNNDYGGTRHIMIFDGNYLLAILIRRSLLSGVTHTTLLTIITRVRSRAAALFNPGNT